METQLLNTGNEDVYIWNWDLCWNPARGLTTLDHGGRLSVHGDFLFDAVLHPKKGDV